MSGDKPRTGFDLAERYALGASAEWQKLLTHLEWREGFSFLVLLTPDGDGAEVCRRALELDFSRSDRSMTLLRPDGPAELRELAERLLELETPVGTAAVWVEAAVPEGVNAYKSWRDAWRDTLARLNRYRNTLQQKFDLPLIFVGAPWLQEVLRETAPDLWSVRALVVRIEPIVSPPETGTPRLYAPDLVDRGIGESKIDPEYTLQAAEKLRGRPGTEALLASLLHRAGTGFLEQRNLNHAMPLLTEAVQLRRCYEPNSEALADSLYQLSYALDLLKDYEEATIYARQALNIYHALNLTQYEVSCYYKLGSIAINQSRHDEAAEYYDNGIALCGQINNRSLQALGIKRLGDVRQWQSRYSDAIALYLIAHSLFHSEGDLEGEALCDENLAYIALQMSRYEGAAAYYDKALTIFRRVGNRIREAGVLHRLGECYGSMSRPAEAEKYYREALSIYHEMNRPDGEAFCLSRLGYLAAARSSKNEAREYYERSLGLYQQMGSPEGIGFAYYFLATVTDDAAEQQRYVAASREAWTSINFLEGLERLNTTFGSNTGTE